MKKLILLSLLILCVEACTNKTVVPTAPAKKQLQVGTLNTHVLIISVDGMHSADLANYVQQNPNSELAALSNQGLTYSNAMTTAPSDSFPGTAAIFTGASPETTGIYYDVSYDRALSPPGSNCSTLGTAVNYDESIDFNPNALDAGGGINPALLPRDPKAGCTPVYPHQYLHVNTLFEVVKNHGGRTAWSDKHPSYDFLNGPSGKGVDDLYNPEINGDVDNVPGITSSIQATQDYDTIKVQVILNQIRGMDHTGTQAMGTPILFGMNFQALSVAQKLSGYKDAKGSFSPGLKGAFDYVDQALKKMTDALRAQGLLASTVIVIMAKHGQGPMDPSKRQIISDKLVPSLVNGLKANLVAQATLDDIGLIWLTDQTQIASVVNLLNQHRTDAGIRMITNIGNPMSDSRAPDLVLETVPGVIYSSPKATKFAEHGGLSDDDRHVALLLVKPGEQPGVVTDPVELKQIAPTVLEILGIAPTELEGVAIESTNALPRPW